MPARLNHETNAVNQAERLDQADRSPWPEVVVTSVIRSGHGGRSWLRVARSSPLDCLTFDRFPGRKDFDME